MATKTTRKEMTADQLIGMYMDYVLEHDTEPKSIYKFCKDNKIEEDRFYQYFGSVAGIKEAIWNKFHTTTVELLHNNEAYGTFSNRDKMLTYFFTFFELLNKNRSYVLFTLANSTKGLENLGQLKSLRKHIKEFAKDLIDDANADKNLKLTQQSPQLFSEGAWLQFMFLLRFWMNDTSAGFEKTDLAIEKSVRTVFDVFDNSILDGLVDFGKFLYKSKLA